MYVEIDDWKTSSECHCFILNTLLNKNSEAKWLKEIPLKELILMSGTYFRNNVHKFRTPLGKTQVSILATQYFFFAYIGLRFLTFFFNYNPPRLMHFMKVGYIQKCPIYAWCISVRWIQCCQLRPGLHSVYKMDICLLFYAYLKVGQCNAPS